ncbi:MAG: hypothetical protein IJW25_01240, partial [Clostridia bacterium]|nr:hypothetical protein [Clostridia bacterium]
IRNGENIVIFPEKSENGYQETLEVFYGCFVMLAETCKRGGIDLTIFASYYNKKNKVYLIDAPIKYSALIEKYKTRDEIAKALCDRCNELGKMTYDESYKNYLKPNNDK